jgi:hypothetical protein
MPLARLAGCQINRQIYPPLGENGMQYANALLPAVCSLQTERATLFSDNQIVPAEIPCFLEFPH